MQFKGSYTNADNTNGIQVIADPNGSKFMFVELTDRYQVTTSFSDAAKHIIYSQALGATPAAYLFVFDLVVLDTTSNIMAAYSVRAPTRTNGATGTTIEPTDIFISEEGAMSGLSVLFGVPSDNTFVISVQGFNTDKLDYNLTGTYTVVT